VGLGQALDSACTTKVQQQQAKHTPRVSNKHTLPQQCTEWVKHSAVLCLDVQVHCLHSELHSFMTCKLGQQHLQKVRQSRLYNICTTLAALHACIALRTHQLATLLNKQQNNMLTNSKSDTCRLSYQLHLEVDQ
jgi:hypothetical protein